MWRRWVMVRYVVPTHVGVDRGQPVKLLPWYGCPHTRGGGPVLDEPLFPFGSLSPHTWGWTV